MSASTPSRLANYIAGLGGNAPDSGAAAYYASLDQVASVSPSIAASVVDELRDQRANVKMIASENYCSLATQLAMGNLLTDKYAEGKPNGRFYAGCDNVDAIETEAKALAEELFGADHAYVQPHSGVDANFSALFAILFARVRAPYLEKLGDKRPEEVSAENWRALSAELTKQKLLGLDYYSGGHLTHGYRFNIISNLVDVHTYTVDPETMLLDYDAIWRQLQEVRPLIFLAGYSAYSRAIDFAKMRDMADQVGAVLWVDMAHFAGLVAGKVFQGNEDPVAHAQMVSTTTHKTLRGPRGGMVLCQDEFAEWADKGCPTNLGGPMAHVMAAKAVSFREAMKPAFQDYAGRIVENARALAEACVAKGMNVLTGGTDNHMIVIDIADQYGLTGRQAETALRDCGMTLNRNAIPFDRNGAWFTSGLRVGTPATTTLGMGADEMAVLADVMHGVLAACTPDTVNGKPSRAKVIVEPTAAAKARAQVSELLQRYPLYPEIDLDIAYGGADAAAQRAVA